MNIEAKRIELAKWILETEEEILAEVDDIRNNSSTIVCKTVIGNMLTKEQYKQKLLEAEARIEAGEFTDHDQLLEEMGTW
ncbi:hypothetical protein [Aequorivita capsosiphonis]|uniref:hypothetical protein n=1 Tax=Aequorivita capsosiphonis TaxID=487317 RepID=UPI00041AEE33|nr:hypothetical protein [Aequorivita capsosiphonis]